MAERLNSTYIELEDLSAELEKAQMEIEFDPIRQNFVEERLNTIYSLEQKHKVSTIAELLQSTTIAKATQRDREYRRNAQRESKGS